MSAHHPFQQRAGMERMLVPRIGAAKLALEETDGEARDMLSKIQAAAIVEIAAREPGLPSMSAEIRARLVSLASAAPWRQQDLVAILKSLSPPDVVKKGEAEAQRRRPMQHWAPAILGYFTMAEWNRMLNEHNDTVAREIVLGRVVELGGRNLSEPTMHCLASLLLIVSGKHALRVPYHGQAELFHSAEGRIQAQGQEARQKRICW